MYDVLNLRQYGINPYGYSETPVSVPQPQVQQVQVGSQIQGPDYSQSELDPYGNLPRSQAQQDIQTLRAPQVNPGQGPNGYQDILRMVNEVYTPETVDRDRYRAQLDRYPEYQQPSGMGRWAAALMGIGAGGRQGGNPIEVMDRALLGSYPRDVEAWKNQTDAYSRAAQYENTANVNERNMAANAITGWAAAERNRIAEENNRQRNDIAAIRANAYAAKQQGATVEIEGGIAIAKYPGPNPRVEVLGRIPGVATEAELANIRGSWNLQAANARGAVSQSNTRTTMGGIMTGPDGNPYMWDDSQGRFVPAPGLPTGGGPSYRPGTAPRGPGGVAEQNRTNDARVRDYLRGRPELNAYVSTDERGNNYAMNNPPPPPESSWFGSNQQEWNDYWHKMKAYNEIKAIVAPGTRPSPIVGWDTPAPDGTPPRNPNPQPGYRPSSTGPDTSQMPATGAPPQFQNVPNGAMVQGNPSQGYRYTTDGGRTWHYSQDGINWN